MTEIIADFFSALWQDMTAYFSAPLGFGGPLVTGQIIIWAIVIGFAVCAAVSLFNKIFLGRLIFLLLLLFYVFDSIYDLLNEWWIMKLFHLFKIPPNLPLLREACRAKLALH